MKNTRILISRVATSILFLSSALAMADPSVKEDSTLIDPLSLHANQRSNVAGETRAKLLQEAKKATQNQDKVDYNKAYQETRAKLIHEADKATQNGL